MPKGFLLAPSDQDEAVEETAQALSLDGVGTSNRAGSVGTLTFGKSLTARDGVKFTLWNVNTDVGRFGSLQEDIPGARIFIG